MVGHLVHRYSNGTESPVPVQLKSLGDGSVMTRIPPSPPPVYLGYIWDIWNGPDSRADVGFIE